MNDIIRHDLAPADDQPTSSLQLLDMINAARRENREPSLRRNVFHDRVADELDGEHYKKIVVLNPNGTQSQAYALSRDQCMLVSMRESKAVRRSVLAKLKQPAAVSQREMIEGAGAFLDALRVEGSSRITCMKAFAASNCPQYLPLIPDYAVDAPAVAGGGSSMPTASASDLLKRHTDGVSAAFFNKVCHSQGILEKKFRTNSKGKEVHYWCLTHLGLEYGKNVTSPQSPRQTQPHWYEDKFDELLQTLGLVKAA